MCKTCIRKKKKENGKPVIVMKIGEKIISGKQTELITAPCSLIINLILQSNKRLLIKIKNK